MSVSFSKNRRYQSLDIPFCIYNEVNTLTFCRVLDDKTRKYQQHAHLTVRYVVFICLVYISNRSEILQTSRRTCLIFYSTFGLLLFSSQRFRSLHYLVKFVSAKCVPHPSVLYRLHLCIDYCLAFYHSSALFIASVGSMRNCTTLLNVAKRYANCTSLGV